jgi:hypothetical protein
MNGNEETREPRAPIGRLGPDAFERLTAEAIAGDPYKAVHLEIPPDASRELLALIGAVARDLRETLSGIGKAEATGRTPAFPARFRAHVDELSELLTGNERSALAAKAARREMDAEARLERLAPEAVARAIGEESMYERYPGLTRDASGEELNADRGMRGRGR